MSESPALSGHRRRPAQSLSDGQAPVNENPAPVTPTRARSPRLLAFTSLAAAGLLAGLVLGRPELVVLAAPFAVILVAGLALAEEPVFDVAFGVDSLRVLQGDSIEVTVTVASSIAIPHVEVLLTAPPGLSFDGGKGATTAGAVSTAPDAPGVLRWRVTCPQWGAFRIGLITLRAHDRSGLLQWDATCDRRVRLRVLPSAGVLRSLVRPHRTLATAGNQVARDKGQGVEFADIRPFQVGDRPRAVNWKASARRGELWVNERHHERNADIVLFLDSFADPDIGNAALERAVRAACSLAAGYLRNRDRVGVIDFGGLQWLAPSMGQAALYRIIDVLVAASPLWTEADRTIKLVPTYFLPPRSLVIALTPLLDPRVDEVLIDLRRRRADLVVLEIDPEASAVVPGGAFGPLALRLWLLERDRRRHALERLGAVVVRWYEDEPLAQAMTEVDRCHRRRHG